MKKTISFLLCLLLLFSMTGCKYKVKTPMKYPDYTFAETPDTTQLRETAVRAMRDILSIQWCTEKEITYRKTGPVRNKQFLHEPRKTYAGLIYSQANTGIFQFLEYYNYETGCLEYPGTSDELKMELGSSCADALLWAWSTVSNSFTGGYYPVMMVPKNGYQIVGDYTYNTKILSYNELPSYTIIENNELEVILNSYTKVLPADALVSTSDNHAMMVIEAPTVVYLADGSIDTANSYVMIQDQRAGGTTGYEYKIDGRKVYFSGRLSAKITFDELLEKDYIPVTIAEFTGDKAYDKAEVSIQSAACSTLADTANATVESNYPLAVINITVTDAEGNITLIDKVCASGYAVTGVPRTYALGTNEELNEFIASQDNYAGCKFQVEVVVATGERFIPIEFTI